MATELEVFQHQASDEDHRKRVDKWLSYESGLSRSRLKALMLQGNVTVNDVVVDNPASKTIGGAVYAITIPAPVAAIPQAENIPLDILFEDEHLVIVNKQAGMTVHPAAGNWTGTLVNALLHHCGDSLAGIGGVQRPGIVHRIDKDTSGILVVAKSDLAHQRLSKQFAAHTVERAYICFTRRAPMPREGRIETRLARSPKDRKKIAVVKEIPEHMLRFPDDDREQKGKIAITNYKFLKGYGQQKGGSIGSALVSKIECRLETGRTHQIRVHMAHIMCPLLGDPAYGKSGGFKTANSESELLLKDALSGFKRQALHAKTLGFIHPVSKEQVIFESDLPPDIQALETALSRLT